jgi:O-antigen/teichoic acid export membrane protein
MAGGAAEVTRQRAMRDVLVQVVAKILNLALGLVVTAIVVRTLGDSGYGQWTTVLAIYQIVGYFATLGMDTVAVREAASRPEEASDWVSALVVTRLVLSLPVMVAGLVILLFVHDSHAMLVAGLILLLDFPIGTTASLAVVHQLRVSNTLPMVVMTINSVVWGVLVLVVHARDGGLIALACALLATTAIAGSVQLVAAIRIIGFKLRPSRAAISRLLRTGTSVGIASMLMLAYGNIDQIIVFQQAGAVDAGQYGAAYRIMVQAHFVPASLMTTLAPIIAATAFVDRRRMLRILGLAVELMAIGALGGLAFSLVASEPAVRLVFGEDFAPSADALPILAGAFAVMCVGYLTGNVMLVMQRTRRQAAIALVGLVVNVTGNLILVPKYGFIAAAWMTLATEVVVVGAGVVVSVRALGLTTPPLGRTPRVALAAAILWGILAALNAVGVPFGVLCLATVVVYPPLLLALRAVALSDLRMLRGGLGDAGPAELRPL